MSIRGLILRALIALSMLFGMAGTSQAQPSDWVRANGNIGFVSFEVEQQVLNGVARDSLWKSFLSKIKWSKVATRVAAGGCVVGGTAAFLSDTYNKQRTWYLKGARILSSCAAGAATVGLMDFVDAALVAIAAPEMVAFTGGLLVAGAAAFGLEYLVERMWAAHTINNGTADTTSDPNNNIIPRGTLEVHDHEYWGSTKQWHNHHLLWKHKHPSSPWVAGTTISKSTATRVGSDVVGGHRLSKYKPAASCGG